MSRETATLTTFVCDSCDASESIGGDFPETVVEEKGWRIQTVVLDEPKDLCGKCVRAVRDALNPNAGLFETSVREDVHGVGMDLTEGGTR